MIIDLSSEIDFWQYGTPIFSVVGVICFIALILAFFFVKSRKRKKDAYVKASANYENLTKKQGAGQKVSASTSASINDLHAKRHEADCELDSANTRIIVAAGIAVFAVVGGFMFNGALSERDNARQDIINVENTINETYDVEISYADAEMLMTYDPTNKSGKWIVGSEANDESSETYLTAEAYGTGIVLKENGEAVEAQLIRAKQEFLLVYADPEKKAIELLEIEKRMDE